MYKRQGTGYALVPAVALVIAIGAWRLLPDRGAALRRATLAGLALAVPVGAWLVLARVLDRAAVNKVPGTGGGGAAAAGLQHFGLLDYLWQFYLPKLPFQSNVPAIPRLPVYDIWLKGGWAAFGWLEVRFPNPVYAAKTA